MKVLATWPTIVFLWKIPVANLLNFEKKQGVSKTF